MDSDKTASSRRGAPRRTSPPHSMASPATKIRFLTSIEHGRTRRWQNPPSTVAEPPLDASRTPLDNGRTPPGRWPNPPQEWQNPPSTVAEPPSTVAEPPSTVAEPPLDGSSLSELGFGRGSVPQTLVDATELGVVPHRTSHKRPRAARFRPSCRLHSPKCKIDPGQACRSKSRWCAARPRSAPGGCAGRNSGGGTAEEASAAGAPPAPSVGGMVWGCLGGSPV